MKTIPRIAIFASGNGSNAQRIADYFKETEILEIASIYCNNPTAFVIERSRNMGIPCFLFNRDTFRDSKNVLLDLQKLEVDWIILAGFLWLVPDYLINAFPDRIINIHPALLPKYGGKGMYGDKVHQAVIDARETESGITIHYVNNHYDEGKIIFQAKCPVMKDDSPSDLAARIHKLEYQYYPKVISDLILENALMTRK
jgi:phosphoribosylglycinamide formyltransferase 1